ncbi:MAG: JAB domain-containing protein [Lachnospiraceae bacterium]|nr:JAB domain-containing protein [Lachnospiraceae bacterium]
MSQEIQGDELEELIKYPDSGKRIGIVHLKMVKERRSLYGMKQFAEPKEAAAVVMPLFAHADRELIVVMSLSTRLEPLAMEIVAVGGLDNCCIDIRNVFKHALLSNANYIICFHNHPSGYPEPSEEDCQVTKKIEAAGKLLGILLLDHIIIGDGNFYSYKEAGALEAG